MIVEHVKDGSPWPRGYTGGEIVGMQPGEVRDVSVGTLAYLLATFPGHFRQVPDPAEAPAEASAEASAKKRK